MKHINTIMLTTVLFGLLVLSLLRCEYKGPEAIWSPVPSERDDPKITAILPDDIADPGVLYITIEGENFFPAVDSNTVYINGHVARQKSATADEIVIYRPTVIGTNLRFAIDVPGMKYRWLPVSTVATPIPRIFWHLPWMPTKISTEWSFIPHPLLRPPRSETGQFTLMPRRKIFRVPSKVLPT
jgi:hypothetical protein